MNFFQEYNVLYAVKKVLNEFYVFFSEFCIGVFIYFLKVVLVIY